MSIEMLSEQDRLVAETVGRSIASTWRDWPVDEAVETVSVGLAAWRSHEGPDHYRWVISEALITHARLHEMVADAAVDSIEQTWAGPFARHAEAAS